jgi:acyl-CoA reductase-like NAD-dependent aldehyde dehydrogenase
MMPNRVKTTRHRMNSTTRISTVGSRHVSSSLVDEEQFGPILPISKFSGVDDALVNSAR